MYDERNGHESGAPLLANPAPAFDPYPSLSSAMASLSTGNDENADDDHLIDLPMPPGTTTSSVATTRKHDTAYASRVKSDDDDLLQVEDAVAIDKQALGFSRGAATPPPAGDDDDDDELVDTAGYMTVGPSDVSPDHPSSASYGYMELPPASTERLSSASYGYMELPPAATQVPTSIAHSDTEGYDGAFGYATLEPPIQETSGPSQDRASSMANTHRRQDHVQQQHLQQQPQTFTRPLTFAGGGLPEDFLRLMEPFQVPIGSTLGMLIRASYETVMRVLCVFERGWVGGVGVTRSMIVPSYAGSRLMKRWDFGSFCLQKPDCCSFRHV
eukprot:m.23445 g.23445  ORF g.23445 m.23445 type:complete len:328 (-) comp12939_c0_seq8:1771-2754(-)